MGIALIFTDSAAALELGQGPAAGLYDPNPYPNSIRFNWSKIIQQHSYTHFSAHRKWRYDGHRHQNWYGRADEASALAEDEEEKECR